jgi:hypothetical protein
MGPLRNTKARAAHNPHVHHLRRRPLSRPRPHDMTCRGGQLDLVPQHRGSQRRTNARLRICGRRRPPAIWWRPSVNASFPGRCLLTDTVAGRLRWRPGQAFDEGHDVAGLVPSRPADLNPRDLTCRNEHVELRSRNTEQAGSLCIADEQRVSQDSYLLSSG